MRSPVWEMQGRSRLGWPLTIATAFAILFACFAIWAMAVMFVQPQGVDFLSFWSAGTMAVNGNAAAAYDIDAHRQVEHAVVPHVGLLPFPYPPAFLLFLIPFALLPFAPAFALWVAATAVIYLLGSKRFASLPYAFANPPILVDLLIGQTGLLTGGIFMLGTALVATAPLLAGTLLGLLVLKPQLALMLPVAMLAGRKWRTIAAAVASAALVILSGWLVFGIEAHRAFIAILPTYAENLQRGGWDWIELASPFAALRYAGLGQATALALHVAIALAAAACVWIAWSRDWDEKAPILAASTLLGSPYLLTYDAVLLIVPAGYLLARQRYWSVGLIWLLSALPVVHFFQFYEGPNTIPIAAILAICLLGVHRENRRLAEKS